MVQQFRYTEHARMPWQLVTERKPIAGRIGGGKKTCLILVLILGAVGSLPLVILTPPFQAPDEGSTSTGHTS